MLAFCAGFRGGLMDRDELSVDVVGFWDGILGVIWAETLVPPRTATKEQIDRSSGILFIFVI